MGTVDLDDVLRCTLGCERTSPVPQTPLSLDSHSTGAA